ncbi:Na(+)/H(+) antiporter subunit A [Thermaurantimonas aggregans]|uniref:Na(+)/H(+) antiporter subunit A n=1 Tax=Thermaurantimonas aggregans TaxID=2173829 RepID=A0A401XML2_9FLAO|nr:hydrogen gas-evolving membrane-bound hydrogenase subunit E [Thermaurantimonas aggregans]MCX8147699.1 proton-conducting transporter membrane subunit [Thermaurantimonas aggregans]GCD78244.1 Na(+)/H(+) antiporter subunit A [Thermaurantimonas aggregans]
MVLFFVLAGVLLSSLLVLFRDYLKEHFSAVFFVVPVAIFIYFTTYLNVKEPFTGVIRWQDGLGVHFEWRIDGLSLLFLLLISGIGTLVFAYSHYYLKGHPEKFRFYGFLSLFMTAMLGLVVSDNLAMMFMFWELTSISSFFLIGFHYEEKASRDAALRALTITGMGGVALLLAAILISSVTGNFSFSALLANRDMLLESKAGQIAFWLILIAAFTKSAQFPFHFWLPGAMKAPTPVSTYLHSATMVKAGVFLLLRFYPVYAHYAYWQPVLMSVGGITMLYSAVQALLFRDMKSILAYTTLSALGILVFLTGIGGEQGISAAIVFIAVHAFYKAALFLVTGIVDHETHTRDITQLSGLIRSMPGIGVAALIAALSHGGVPLTFGFVGKEFLYEAAYGWISQSYLPILSAFVAGCFLFVAGLWVGVKPFFGTQSSMATDRFHVSLWMSLPVYILAALSMVFGLFPGLMTKLIEGVLRVNGFESEHFHVALWHGFTPVFFLSLATVALGGAIFFLTKPGELYRKSVESLSFSSVSIYDKIQKTIKFLSQLYTNLLQNGYLRLYVLMIMIFLMMLVGYSLFRGVHIYIDFRKISEVTFYEATIVFLLIFSTLFILLAKSRLAAVAAMGVLGISISLMFVFYSAPDLAMTQFSIDTLTVILFVLVLYKLPKYINASSIAIKVRDVIVSALFGVMITMLALEVLNEPVNRETSEYYVQNSYLLAKGKNVVNVILVDFRGADTMVEITVLTIAALGVFGLMKLRLKDNEKTWE